MAEKMDVRYQSLPPLKRLRLMQKKEEEEQMKKEDSGRMKSSRLPAKKRKESRLDYAENAVSSFCLPAKKRIWAIDPEMFSGKPLLPFDLNLEYNPPVEGKLIGRDGNGMVVPDSEVEGKENIDPIGTSKKFKSVRKLGKEEIAISSQDKDGVEVKIDEIDDDLDDGDDGIVCAVCNSTDGDPSDPIVFCDGCDLMVHATCYGNPLVKAVPEGDWFCEQCKAIQDKNDGTETFSCCLCPVKSGSIKPTNDGQWAHITCSLFVPEVFFEDPEGREGINCSEIPKKRWNEQCHVCESRNGCAIECSEMKCPLSFHVTCGLNEGFCIEYREGKKKKKGGIVAGFCKDHSMLWEKQQQTGKFKIVARDE